MEELHYGDDLDLEATYGLPALRKGLAARSGAVQPAVASTAEQPSAGGIAVS